MKIELIVGLLAVGMLTTELCLAYESSPFVQSPDVTQAPQGQSCASARGNGSLVCRGDGACREHNNQCFSCTSGMNYQTGLGCYSCVQGTSLKKNQNGQWVCSD